MYPRKQTERRRLLWQPGNAARASRLTELGAEGQRGEKEGPEPEGTFAQELSDEERQKLLAILPYIKYVASRTWTASPPFNSLA